MTEPLYAVEPPLDEVVERVPSDLRAEMCVVGSMMLDRRVVDDVVEVMHPADHWRPAHETIHAAILRLVEAGQPCDAVSVGDELGKRGDLQRVGGMAYLHTTIQAVPTSANAGYYAKVVAEQAALRRLVEAGTRIVQLGHQQGNGDVDDIVDAAVAEVQAVAEGRLRDDAMTSEQATYAALETLERPVGPPTPWKALTDALAGWAPGWLYIAGARPGVGKTAFACGIAVDTAQRGLRALFISLEMPQDELRLRMLQNIGTVDGQRMLHRNLTEADWMKLRRASSRLAALPLTVDDRSNLSLAQIRARIRGEQRRGEVGVVLIDYLSLIRPPSESGRQDRRVQVDAIAQGLKNLARDLRVPIVALAQLNRQIEGRSDKIPTLADLRESGGIEAAADVVLLMHRDHIEAPNLMRVTLPKNRHGPQAMIELDFLGQFSRLTDRGWGDVA
jgi:replicative DNA helicase